MAFKKGNTVMLGRKLDEETRQKMRDSHKGIHPSRWGAGFRKGNVPWNTGTNFNRNSYFAGLFDGEGSAFITGNGRSGTKYRSVCVSMSFRADEAQPLEEAYKIWGGALHKRISKDPKRGDVLQWRLSTRSAEKFLLNIKPFLRIKKEVVDLILKYRWMQVEKKKQPDGSISQEDWEYRLDLETKIKHLNNPLNISS